MRPTAPIQQGAELARGSLGCCHHRALPPCQLRLCHRASLGQLSNLLAKQPLGGRGGRCVAATLRATVAPSAASSLDFSQAEHEAGSHGGSWQDPRSLLPISNCFAAFPGW